MSRHARPSRKPARRARAPELPELGHGLPPRVPQPAAACAGATPTCAARVSHAQFELLVELDERGELPAGELAARRRA